MKETGNLQEGALDSHPEPGNGVPYTYTGKHFPVRSVSHKPDP
jgi:hypothetical protein